MPIEHALEQSGADFLNGGSPRKLLVLVMDGMSWPNAVELLLSLEEELGGRHAPLCWMLEARQRLPVLAALPSPGGAVVGSCFTHVEPYLRLSAPHGRQFPPARCDGIVRIQDGVQHRDASCQALASTESRKS